MKEDAIKKAEEIIGRMYPCGKHGIVDVWINEEEIWIKIDDGRSVQLTGDDKIAVVQAYKDSRT